MSATVTRGQLKDIARRALADETGTKFPDDSLAQWCENSIQRWNTFFAVEDSATIALTADVRTYSLTSYTGLRRVKNVEYPSSNDPPQPLTCRCYEDPEGFYGGLYWDTRGTPPTTLILGPSPAAGESLILRYWRAAAYPSDDGTLLEVPDEDINCLKEDIVTQAMEYLAHKEAQNAGPSGFALSQLGTEALRRRRNLLEEYRTLRASRESYLYY